MSRAGFTSGTGNWMIVILTALAPIIWGTTYLVTTEFLPANIPYTAAMIRVLPAGLVLILWKRVPIKRSQWGRLLVLSALNISVFQALLFVAAYRLPGGLASVLGSLQPLIILFLAWVVDQRIPQARTVVIATMAVAGMALLFVRPQSSWDLFGILAAAAGTISMSTGTFLAKRWQSGIPLVPFVGWQLLLGGIMLSPVALALDGLPGQLETIHLGAFIYLSVVGALIGYALWFQGIRKLPPAMVASLGLLSPLTAVVLGWVFLGQNLNAGELAGMLIVLISVIIIQLQYQKNEKQREQIA